jgi:GNAT superfamily N-acetyltransferase
LTQLAKNGKIIAIHFSNMRVPEQIKSFLEQLNCVSSSLLNLFLNNETSDKVEHEIEIDGQYYTLEIVKSNNIIYLVRLKDPNPKKQDIFQFEFLAQSDSIQIHHREVRRDYRRRGIATKITEEIEKFTQEASTENQKNYYIFYTLSQRDLLLMLLKMNYTGWKQQDTNLISAITSDNKDQFEIDPDDSAICQKGSKRATRITLFKSFTPDTNPKNTRQKVRYSLQKDNLPLN